MPGAVPLPEDYRLERGRGVGLTEGHDAVLFAYGPVMLSEAYRAAGLLRERHGLALRVVNLPWLNLVDADWLAAEIADVRAGFTLDDHYVNGGQGELIAAPLAERGRVPAGGVRRLGVRSIPACGQNDEVLRAHRLDAESLAADLAEAMPEARSIDRGLLGHRRHAPHHRQGRIFAWQEALARGRRA